MSRILPFLFLLLLLAVPSPTMAQTRWSLVREYPHDRTAFTQGLLYQDGLLYESTGLEGQSRICMRRLEKVRPLRCASIPPDHFGEGIALWKNRIVSLTWRGGTGFLWKLPGLSRAGSFSYAGEGWALTHDGARLIMSDGTADLRFLNPETLRETGRITVTLAGTPLPNLNELEYVDGEILANVWMTNVIARIDPADGHVIATIDLSALVKAAGASDPDDVLNGIAWDAKGRRLFVTGKRWPKIFEIRLER